MYSFDSAFCYWSKIKDSFLIGNSPRYGFLLLEHVASQDPLSVSVAILQQFHILPDMYQVGYTKLFFRTGQVRSIHVIISSVYLQFAS